MASTAPTLAQTFRSSVILFPGQGSQYVGMVKNLCDKGRSLFEMANHVLYYDLLKLCQNGPEDDLNRTIHSQPAVFVSSLAAVERLASMSSSAVENCVATAGFSLGELSALVFAQSIDFIDALRLIKIRAEITQELSDKCPSGMISVLFGTKARIGMACKMAEEYCIRTGMSEAESVCSVSNYLFPHGKIIGGNEVALKFIDQNRKDFGIVKIKRLPVSGAFHTQLMKPSQMVLRNALAKIKIKEPKIKVYSNVDANYYKSPDEIRKNLERHVFKPVLWEQTLHNMYETPEFEEYLPVTFECGPQNQMTTILGMVNKKARLQAYNIEP